MISLADRNHYDEIYDIYKWHVIHSDAIFDLKPRDKEDFFQMLDTIGQTYPVLTATWNGKVIGYGYLHRAFEKEAYCHEAELTIYFQEGNHHHLASKMYKTLERAALEMGVGQMISCITDNNVPSIAFHEKMGFEKAGALGHAGLKHGRWLGVVWYAKLLEADPKPLRPFSQTDTYGRLQDQIQGVLFDMDGLLFDTERMYLDVFPTICARRNLYPAKEEIFTALGRDSRAIEALEGKYPGIGSCMEEFLVHRKDIFFARFQKGEADKAGLCECLAFLEENGIPYGICSGSDRQDIEAFLQHSAWNFRAACILSTKEGIQPKPAPDVFLKGADMLNVRAQNVLVADDSPFGIEAGLSGGFVTVWIEDQVQFDPGCAMKMNSLMDVKEYLAGGYYGG